MSRQTVSTKVRNGYKKQYKVFVAHKDEDLGNGSFIFHWLSG